MGRACLEGPRPRTCSPLSMRGPPLLSSTLCGRPTYNFSSPGRGSIPCLGLSSLKHPHPSDGGPPFLLPPRSTATGLVCACITFCPCCDLLFYEHIFSPPVLRGHHNLAHGDTHRVARCGPVCGAVTELSTPVVLVLWTEAVAPLWSIPGVPLICSHGWNMLVTNEGQGTTGEKASVSRSQPVDQSGKTGDK